MTKDKLLESIVNDLGANYLYENKEILSALLDDVINDALFISNRDKLVEDEETLEKQLDVLSSNIKRTVKTIYLQRGSEDVISQTISGLNSTFDKAILSMKDDIIKSGKRIIK